MLSLPWFPEFELGLLSWVLVIAIFWMFATGVYNVFFHPLAKFPGPLLARLSDIPHCISSLSGRQPYRMLDLHNKYGPVVRVAPNELSYSSSESWKDIYGTGNSNSSVLPKAKFYDKFVLGLTSIVSERNIAKHRDMRKQIAPAFSDKALKDQEPLIANIIDQFVDRIGTVNTEGVDLVKWFNLITFEIVGELAFGASFEGITTGDPHPWVSNAQNSMAAGFVIDILSKSPTFGVLLILRHCFWMYKLARGMIENKRYTSQVVDERVERGSKKPDFISAILEESERSQQETSIEQMKAHSADVIFAGSETTATLLAALFWYILHHPQTYSDLQSEVRSTFSNYNEIDNAACSKLSRLYAVCCETLRVYPPLPFGLPRACPKGGATIAGTFVPENTVVSTHPFAASMSEMNFSEPWKFRPERWLEEVGQASDNLAASKPFSVGSRACLGKSLGWLEMRTIIAKLIYTYDFELVEDRTSKDWHADSRVYLFWKKPELNVRLIPRKT